MKGAVETAHQLQSRRSVLPLCPGLGWVGLMQRGPGDQVVYIMSRWPYRKEAAFQKDV